MVPGESSIAWLKSIQPSAQWLDATAWLHQQRARKTEAEIARLRLAHRVAGLGLNRFRQAVAPGISEAELAGLVYAECLGKGVRLPGVRHVNVYPQISSGPNSHRPGGRWLRPAAGGSAAASSPCWSWPSAPTAFGPT